jgi:exodeoxyribonuclease-3
LKRIITWNIRHGGGSRVLQLYEIIIKQNADIVVLTEFRNNRYGLELRKKLLDSGYIHQWVTSADENTNSVLISSIEPYCSQHFEFVVEHNNQRVVKIYSKDFSLYGLYFPQKDEKKVLFEFILSEIKKNPNEKSMFIGDFNTGRHFVDEAKSTFACSDYMDKIEQTGYSDAWRYVNKDAREYSWYSNSGNGFRIDHVFVHKELVSWVDNCYYIHDVREEKISDHSMMVLELR